MDIKARYEAQGSKLVTTKLPEARRYNTKRCSCGIASTVLIVAEVREVMPNGGQFPRGFVAESGAKVVGEVAGVPVVECRGCAKRLVARPVIGRLRPNKKCDARCTHASGHQCECACGGLNHGAGQVAA